MKDLLSTDVDIVVDNRAVRRSVVPRETSCPDLWRKRSGSDALVGSSSMRSLVERNCIARFTRNIGMTLRDRWLRILGFRPSIDPPRRYRVSRETTKGSLSLSLSLSCLGLGPGPQGASSDEGRVVCRESSRVRTVRHGSSEGAGMC